MTIQDMASWADFLRTRYGIANPVLPETEDDTDDATPELLKEYL